MPTGNNSIYKLYGGCIIMKDNKVKFCNKCKEYKPIENFCNNITTKDGHSMYCRDCSKKIHTNFIYEQIKKKYDYVCADCKSNINLVIHHIIPRSAGGFDSENNLILLCKKCHLKHHDGNFAYSNRLKVCNICGHSWISKKEIEPKVCAKCHNVYWNIPRSK